MNKGNCLTDMQTLAHRQMLVKFTCQLLYDVLNKFTCAKSMHVTTEKCSSMSSIAFTVNVDLPKIVLTKG